MSSTELQIVRKSATLRLLVEDKLRSAIAMGRFKPGQRLIERELCELTGVGRTSIREALRQLEAEGLVTPQRAASGYRRFTAYDCARLRFILTAQRDQYLPLKVIKAQLDAQPDGELPLTGSPYGVPRLVPVGNGAPSRPAASTRSGFTSRASATPSWSAIHAITAAKSPPDASSAARSTTSPPEECGRARRFTRAWISASRVASITPH